MNRRWSTFIATLVLVLAIAAGGTPRASAYYAVLDLLGSASPTTTFSVWGTSSSLVDDYQLMGPRFTLEAPSRITEIGAFLNNCSFDAGVPQCPEMRPLLVQIRPALNGAPDPVNVIATYTLSDDNDPLTMTFESTSPGLVLPMGTYFALFSAAPGEEGFILASVWTDAGAAYIAEPGTIGGLSSTGQTWTQEGPMAVRILGEPVVTVPLTLDIKAGDTQNAISLTDHGLLPVAVLGTTQVDVSELDPGSVRLGAATLALRGSAQAPKLAYSIEDVNSDGQLDLVAFFDIQTLVQLGILTSGTQTLTLVANGFDHAPYAGSDAIVVVGPTPPPSPSPSPSPSWAPTPTP